MTGPTGAVVVRLPEDSRGLLRARVPPGGRVRLRHRRELGGGRGRHPGAFLRAHRAGAQVGRYDQPGAWVRRVAANLAVSAFRRRLAEAGALLHLAARRQPDPPLQPEAVDFWRPPFARPPPRHAVALYYLEGWPTAEIARFLGCSETTVRGHISPGPRRPGQPPARRPEEDP